jgi:hypothetical protein
MIIIKANLPIRWELDETHEEIQRFIAMEDTDKARLLNGITQAFFELINTKGSFARLLVDDQTITQIITEGDNNE